MPLRNDKRYCINHTDTEMVINEKYSALTEVSKNNNQIIFNPSTGMPVKVFVCRICGYVELYHANAFPEWNSHK